MNQQVCHRTLSFWRLCALSIKRKCKRNFCYLSAFLNAQLILARWLRCLHCRLTARRSWGRFPHGVLLVLGAGSPQAFSAQVGYLLGLSVGFACFPRVHKGFPPLRTPTEKHAKRTEHKSIPD